MPNRTRDKTHCRPHQVCAFLFLPKGDIGSGGSRSLQDLVLALPCLDMMAAILKSVAQGLIVHLSSITSSSHTSRRRRRRWRRRNPTCQTARETDHAYTTHHVETLAAKECSRLLPFFGEVSPLPPTGDDNVRRSPFRTWAGAVLHFLRGGGAKEAPPMKRPHLTTTTTRRDGDPWRFFNSVAPTALVSLQVFWCGGGNKGSWGDGWTTPVD